MANQITDGRTNVSTMETATPVVDLAGTSNGTLDAVVFYEGSNSVGEYCTSTRDGMLFDTGGSQDYSDNTFYLLVNCAIVALLDLKVNGGMAVRFCGTTISDWFEVYVGGSDIYPNQFGGGWAQFVVDIETAYTAAVTNGDAGTNTGGTPPATSAIQYVGISYITDGTMPRMVDNTWLDQIARLPDGSAGIIIEGSESGTTPWSWDDVVLAASTTNKWGTARVGAGGSVVLNTPIQFGINDATDHEFSDNNKTILWDEQDYLADDIYGFTAVMGTGANFIRGGIKTGTGNDATGAQGWTIQAASGGAARWNMDFSDPDVDEVSLYGCSFQHGNIFNFANVDIDLATVLFNDCSDADVTNANVVRASVVNANTADDVAFMKTDNIGDIINSSFEFSDGHAIELTTPNTASQSSIGNRFTGYGAIGSTDAAIYNNSGSGLVTISISAPGLVGEHTYKNGTSASTALSQDVAVTFTGMKDLTEVRIYSAGTTTELAGIEDATAGGVDNRSFTATLAASTSVDYRIFNILQEVIEVYAFSWPAGDQDIAVAQKFDRVYKND